MATKKKGKTQVVKADDDFLQDIPNLHESISSYNVDDYEEEVINSGAEFWKFNNPGDLFVGTYTGQPIIAMEDSKDNGETFKKGDTIGYEFLPTNSKQQVIIPNNYSIEKSMERVVKNDLVKIEFLGKKESGGKPFSSFRITKLIARKK